MSCFQDGSAVGGSNAEANANFFIINAAACPAYTRNCLPNATIESLNLVVNMDDSSADFRDAESSFNQFRLWKLFCENGPDDQCLDTKLGGIRNVSLF